MPQTPADDKSLSYPLCCAHLDTPRPSSNAVLWLGPRLGSFPTKQCCLRRSTPESAGFSRRRWRGAAWRSQHLLQLAVASTPLTAAPTHTGSQLGSACKTSAAQPASCSGARRLCLADTRSCCRFPQGAVDSRRSPAGPHTQTWRPRSPAESPTLTEVCGASAQRDDVAAR